MCGFRQHADDYSVELPPRFIVQGVQISEPNMQQEISKPRQTRLLLPLLLLGQMIAFG